MQRVTGFLSSFGSRVYDDSKYVLPGPSFLLEGDTTGGGSWSTIPIDDAYFVAWFAGYIVQRSYDNAGNPVDFSTATYPGGLRVSYTISDSGVLTAYGPESVTFAPEVDGYGNPVSFNVIGADGQIIDLCAVDLLAKILIAGDGAVILDKGGIRITSVGSSLEQIKWVDGSGNVIGYLFSFDVPGVSRYMRFVSAGGAYNVTIMLDQINNAIQLGAAKTQTAGQLLLQGETNVGTPAAITLGPYALQATSRESPSAPAAGNAYLFAKTVGGKVGLYAKFPSGVDQLIAEEP